MVVWRERTQRILAVVGFASARMRLRIRAPNAPSLACPASNRARNLSPKVHLLRKKVFSTRDCSKLPDEYFHFLVFDGRLEFLCASGISDIHEDVVFLLQGCPPSDHCQPIYSPMHQGRSSSKKIKQMCEPTHNSQLESASSFFRSNPGSGRRRGIHD